MTRINKPLLQIGLVVGSRSSGWPYDTPKGGLRDLWGWRYPASLPQQGPHPLNLCHRCIREREALVTELTTTSGKVAARASAMLKHNTL